MKIKENVIVKISAIMFAVSFLTGCDGLNKTSVTIPTATETTYTYTGNEISLNLSDFDSSKMTISGNTATDIGSYTALVKLSNTSKYKWSDNTTDAKTYTWSIVSQTSVDIPTKINKTLLYTGSTITMLPDNYSDISDYCTISGNTGTDDGSYTATLSLKDTTKYKWSDNTTEDKTIEWSISSGIIKLAIPSNSTSTYYYTGKNVTYTPVNYDSSVETITENVQISAKTYTVTVSITDKDHYTWTNGTKDDIEFTFVLNKGLIVKPTLNNADLGELTYTGNPLTYIPTNFDEYTQYIAISGNSATDVGTYTMTLSLKDKDNTQWADKTSADFTLTWKIIKKQYTVPTSKTYTYTGSLITFYPASYDETAMTITGNTGTETGEYTATVSLIDKDNTEWADETTDDKTITWEIGSASKYYKVVQDSTSITLTHKSTSKVLTIGTPENTTYQINDDNGSLTLTYSETTNADSLPFSMSGEFNGSVNLIVTTDIAVEVALNGVTITDSKSCPLCLSTEGDVDLSAKKGSTNTITDNRSTASDTETYDAAIFSGSDLKLKGQGTLNVYSTAYAGIHCKDDLKIQKLSLYVKSADNAIKGNDSVTVLSGSITAISTYSNGIKTSNSGTGASTGEQKGTVEIDGGTVNIYSALDGIEAAYDAIVTEEDSSTPTTLTIKTCTYSGYSKLTYTKKSSSNSYNSILNGGPGGGGQPTGPTGGDDGNDNRYEESTKGIKADNAITISGGTTTIKAYDDAIHCNNTNILESTSKVGLGNVTISGDETVLSIYSMDDGIHADNILTISGGTTSVTNSYEGLEGVQVILSGGTNSVISTDDGINGTGTSGESIQISGGVNYIYAGGDGVDSNSNSSYDGILFAGGKTVIVQTSGGNSSIDTNQGYKYSGGYVLALGTSSGMSQQESTKCSKFSSIGKATSLSSTYTVSANGYVTVKMPKYMSVYAIFLGSSSTTLSTDALYTSYDSNGVCWYA